MKTRFVLAAGAMAALSGAAAAQDLFALGGFDPFGSAGLYSVDASTGEASLIGDTGVAAFVGLAWTGSDLVGLTTGNELYSIDRATGAASLLFNATGVTAEGDLASSGNDLFASSTGSLASVGGGSVAPAATYGTPLDLSGLAADSAGFIGFATGSGSAGDELYRLDAMGGASLIGATGTASTGVGALDFDFAGALYLSDGASLYTVDTATGAATLVGAFGVDGVSGIAFVPAPGAALAIAGLGLVASRRRRA